MCLPLRPQVLGRWQMDDPFNPPVGDPRALKFNSIKYFDYRDAADRAEALTYREAELPFIFLHAPSVDEVSAGRTAPHSRGQTLATRDRPSP